MALNADLLLALDETEVFVDERAPRFLELLVAGILVLGLEGFLDLLKELLVLSFELVVIVG